MSEFDIIKNKCLIANQKIAQNNLAIATFGNLSIADRDKKVFAIKPSGVSYEKLTAPDIVIVNFQGNIVEGSLNPSSDTKTHLYLYNKWNSVNSICHTHSTYAVAWAQSLLNVPVFGTTHADHVAGHIPCTPPMRDSLIKGDYEHNTGVQIIEHFKKYNFNQDQIQMILIGSHGPFTWGKDENISLYNSLVLEEICKMAYLSVQLKSKLKPIKKTLINKHFDRKHGPNSYYGQKAD